MVFSYSISVKEGAFLYDAGINPYTGDVYHENPLVLIASNALIKYVPALIPFLFVLADLLCAALLYQMSKIVTKKMVGLTSSPTKGTLFIKISVIFSTIISKRIFPK